MIRRVAAALRWWWEAYCDAIAQRGCPHDRARRCPACGGREPGDW